MSRNVLLVLLLAVLGGCTASSDFQAGPEVDAPPPAGQQRGAELTLGRSLLTSDPAQAARLLSAALTTSRNDPIVLNDLGIAFDLLGRHAEAQASYRHALAVKPRLRSARINLAMSLALDGDRTGAMAALALIGAAQSASSVEQADIVAVHALLRE